MSIPAEWQGFLSEAGAIWEAGAVEHFGAPEAEAESALRGDVLADLSHRGIILARGEDAQSLLQGQLTNDLQEVTTERSRLGAWCNPKGRVMTLLRVFRRGEDYALELPAGLLDDVLKRLRLYVLRARVRLEDASPELARIGVAGEDAAGALRRTIGALPEQADGVRAHQAVSVLRLPGTRPRFQLVGPAAEIRELWRALESAARPCGRHAWALLDIETGLPEVSPATADEFLPQMLNLESLGGLSYTKGCFLGQEVIARTHYLGRLKRRLHRGRTDTASLPAPGTPVCAGDGDQAAGTVVTAERHPDGGCALLAVIRDEALGKDTLHVGAPTGAALVLEPLPDADAAAHPPARDRA